MQVCYAAKFSLAGVEDGTQCFCGNAIPASAAPATNCNVTCSGNHKEICGGVMAVNVLTFKCSGPPDPTPSPPLPPAPTPTPPLPPAVKPAPKGAKSVLFFISDDLRPELFGAYGQNAKNKLLTPNFDKLAATSTVFNRAYCQQAICGPTRNSFLSGPRLHYTLTLHAIPYVPYIPL